MKTRIVTPTALLLSAFSIAFMIGISLYFAGKFSAPEADDGSRASAAASLSCSTSAVNGCDDGVPPEEGLSRETNAFDMGVDTQAEPKAEMLADEKDAFNDTEENGEVVLEPAENVAKTSSRRFFVKGQDYSVHDLPDGELKRKLLTLDPERRSR